MRYRVTKSFQCRNDRVEAISEVGKFSSIACSITSHLFVEIFMQTNCIAKVLSFGIRWSSNYAILYTEHFY